MSVSFLGSKALESHLRPLVKSPSLAAVRAMESFGHVVLAGQLWLRVEGVVQKQLSVICGDRLILLKRNKIPDSRLCHFIYAGVSIYYSRCV